MDEVAHRTGVAGVAVDGAAMCEPERGRGAMRRAGVAMAVAVLLCGAAHGQSRIEVDNQNLKVDPAEKVDPQYRRTLEERSRQKREEAERSGESHIDTLHGPFAPARPEPETVPKAAGPDKQDPASAAVQTGSAKREAGKAPERATRRRDEGYEGLDRVEGGGLHELIAELLKRWNRPPEMVRLQRREPRGHPEARAGAEGRPAPGTAAPEFPEVAAGRGLYARVLYAVNSDFPGPVLLEILEPPLAGAVATGAFERVRDRLTIRLNSVSWRGARAPAAGWAVGLDCACFGVEGEVDRHWWERLVLPAAVRFAEGLLTARGTPRRRVQVSGETVVEETEGPGDRQAVYRGLGEAARSAGNILLQDAPTGPTVRIPRNAELAVVFERPPGRAGNRVGVVDPTPRGPPVARVSGTANDSAGGGS